MTDAVATIRIAPGVTLWSADEVPRLTASALFEFVPEPDPEIPLSELRQFTASELHSRAAGRALSASARAAVTRACKAAGLPPLPDRLTVTQWGAYLEAGNADAEGRGWWVGFIPPRDQNLGNRLAWAAAAEEHRKLLKQAIAAGTIQPRMAGTRIPAPQTTVALERLVLTRGELEKFAALLAIAVSDEPLSEPSKPAELQQMSAPRTAARESSATGTHLWNLREPQRHQGYSLPLYRVLKTAHAAGLPKPRARDVLDAFRRNTPSEVVQVNHDGFSYLDATGNAKPADLRAIAEAIRRMTN